MNKAILAVLALAVAASVSLAGGLDFVPFASGTMTNAQATVTLTNGTFLRGYVKSVQVTFSGSANATGTVAIATVPSHGMQSQTLYPATAIVASDLTIPLIKGEVALSAVDQWECPVLMDDKLSFAVSSIQTTGTVSITAFVVYERAMP